MNRLYDLFKNYAAFLGLVGMSFAQVLNFRPSSQSSLAFVLFSLLAVLVVANCMRMLRQTKLVRRTPDFVREPVYSRRTRQATGVILVLTPPVYMMLALFYYIPDIWPIHVQAGAESRVTNPRLAALHGTSLDLGLSDDKVGPLFVPDRHSFSVSPVGHRITIDNRSTIPSPPLKMRLVLQTPQGWTSPPAVFAAAVTSDAVRGWRPLGVLDPVLSRLLPQRSNAEDISERYTMAKWLSFEGWCSDSLFELHKGERWWCYIHPPTRVIDWTQWREPELWLPPIPARSSLEVYFELAFPGRKSAQILPATVEIREATKGEFAVSLSRDVDLGAGSERR